MHSATDYMLSSFTCLLDSTTHGTPYHRPANPDCVSREFIEDCNTIVENLVRAFLNPGMQRVADAFLKYSQMEKSCHKLGFR